MHTREPEPVPLGEADARRLCGVLRAFARRRLGNGPDAEDVAQEALRRVLDALAVGRLHDRAALPAFAIETARHVCQHRTRSDDRRERALGLAVRRGTDAGPDPLQELLCREGCTRVDQALACLRTDDRNLLERLYFEEETTDDLAHRLSVTRASLRVRKHRALCRLADLLAPP